MPALCLFSCLSPHPSHIPPSSFPSASFPLPFRPILAPLFRHVPPFSLYLRPRLYRSHLFYLLVRLALLLDAAAASVEVLLMVMVVVVACGVEESAALLQQPRVVWRCAGAATGNLSVKRMSHQLLCHPCCASLLFSTPPLYPPQFPPQ